MTSLALALLIAAGGTGSIARADDPFRDDLDCIRAVRDCSFGKAAFADTSSIHQYAILFGTRDSVDGFYAFSGEDAYFFKLPAPPRRSDQPKPPPPSLWNLYGVLTRKPPQVDPRARFKLEEGIHDPVYLTFKYEGEDRVFLENVASKPTPGVSYLPATGGECHADSASRAVLRAETLTRINSVYDTWASSPEPELGDVRREMTIVGHDAPKYYNVDACRKALEPCTLSSELRGAAQAQIEKFPPKR